VSASTLENFEKDHKGALELFVTHAIANNVDKALNALKDLNIPELSTVVSGGNSQLKRELVAYLLQAFALEEVSYK
jgi:hypothetical protein